MKRKEAAWGQKALDAVEVVLGHHFSEKNLKSQWYGTWAGGEAERGHSERFYGKRDRFKRGINALISKIGPNATERQVLDQAGHVFESVNCRNDYTFNIDVWVLADLLHSLGFHCFTGESRESIASKLGNDIAKWIRCRPLKEPVRYVSQLADGLHIELWNKPEGDFNIGEALILQLGKKSTPVVVRELKDNGSWVTVVLTDPVAAPVAAAWWKKITAGNPVHYSAYLIRHRKAGSRS